MLERRPRRGSTANEPAGKKVLLGASVMVAFVRDRRHDRRLAVVPGERSLFRRKSAAANARHRRRSADARALEARLGPGSIRAYKRPATKPATDRALTFDAEGRGHKAEETGDNAIVHRLMLVSGSPSISSNRIFYIFIICARPHPDVHLENRLGERFPRLPRADALQQNGATPPRWRLHHPVPRARPYGDRRRGCSRRAPSACFREAASESPATPPPAMTEIEYPCGHGLFVPRFMPPCRAGERSTQASRGVRVSEGAFSNISISRLGSGLLKQ